MDLEGSLCVCMCCRVWAGVAWRSTFISAVVAGGASWSDRFIAKLPQTAALHHDI